MNGAGHTRDGREGDGLAAMNMGLSSRREGDVVGVIQRYTAYNSTSQSRGSGKCI